LIANVTVPMVIDEPLENVPTTASAVPSLSTILNARPGPGVNPPPNAPFKVALLRLTVPVTFNWS
jgi:hypothetical protein